MLHNLVDNRDSKREQKAISDKKRQKKEKTLAFLEDRQDRSKNRSAYRRTKCDWLDAYEEEDFDL